MGQAQPPFVVAFDFATKSHERIALGEAPTRLESGGFVWLDVDVALLSDRSDPLAWFELPGEVVEDALEGDPGTQHARYANCLHLVMSGCQLEALEFSLQRVDVVVGTNYLLTVHDGYVEFIERVKQDYAEDFLHHAETPSFLLYELWDHLIDRYTMVQDRLEERVERLQMQLIEAVDDSLFSDAAVLGADLVRLRKVLLPARAVLTELANRRTRFVSGTTQTFLGNMVGTVERVLQDLMADREILSDSINLHVSAMSHRTNAVMRRLTVVSVLFLPLTFLTGVYGMNFTDQPELHWHHGYLLFWAVAVGVTSTLLVLLGRKRLL